MLPSLTVGDLRPPSTCIISTEARPIPCKPPHNRSFSNPNCIFHGQFGKQNIVRHGFFTLKRGAHRRRYRCSACGKTFASTSGAAYYRLQYPRTTFDEVAELRSEGVSISTVQSN